MNALIKTHWRSLIFFFALIIIVQGMGNIVTIPNIQPWYSTLNKPFWSPPNWLFGPVWTVLYISLAVIGWRLWISFSGSITHTLGQPVIAFYFIQLFLNAIWSPLFFGQHFIQIALADLVLIVLFTILTIYHARKINRACAWGLVPYFLWLSFALSLNAAIVVLN